MIITGSGGKPQRQMAQKQAQSPKEDRNSLFSASYLKTIDLLGEGDIDGLVDDVEGIFLNGTLLMNPGGSTNFDGVSVDSRIGTPDQGYIPGFDEAVSETVVNVTVTADIPVVRTITNTNTNAVRITISVPQMVWQQKDGDIRRTFASLEIDVQYAGGGYTNAVISDTIEGRTSQLYQKQYRIDLSGPFPVDIRVRRTKEDSTTTGLIDAFAWGSYSTITYAKLNYANSAIVVLRCNAEQFSSIPERTYLIRGLKVPIPSNATVDRDNGRLTFSGAWNGTFGAAQWCADPAWCLYALLTSKRYGTGDFINASQLDKWAFYSASVYNSALVPDGFGGWEPRFSCNANIQDSRDVYGLINNMCSCMRVMPYWSGGTLTISQDRPADPVFEFTLANVSAEGFSYSGSSVKDRPTVAIVKYFDIGLRDYAFEAVEDVAAIAKYGINRIEVEAFACTSRGQAHRFGKWLLYTEANEGEVVAFTSSLAAGAVVRPGAIIRVADPMRAGARRGGVVAAATTTAVTVDDAAGLTVANSPTLTVMLANGTIQTRAVSSIAGNVITVAAAFSTAPAPNAIWTFESSNIQKSLWRVLTIEERDVANYTINALAYNPSKYDYIEYGIALQQRDVTDLNVAPEPPQNVTGAEVLYEAGSRALAKLQVSWAAVPGVSSYRVQYRGGGDNWQTQTVYEPSIEIFDTQAGTYEILVSSAKNQLNTMYSQPARLWFTCAGKTAPPADVSGMSFIPIDGASAILSWALAPDLDVRLGGQVLIRHSPRLDTPQWGESISIVPAASGAQTQKQVPLLEGSYLLKFVDDGGRESIGVAYVVADLPQPQARMLVQVYAEDQESPPFNGNGVDMFYSSTFDALVLGSGALISSHASIAALPSIGLSDNSLTQPVVAKGEYEFGSTYNMGGVFDVNIQRRFVVRTLNQLDLFSVRPGLLSSWTSMGGMAGSDVDAALLVRSTLADPDVDPQWSEWRELANGIVRGRAFQFMCQASSRDSSQNILIDELGAVMELQQRIEQSATLTTAAATLVVVFAERFYEAPNLGITGYNLTAGDHWVIDPGSITRFGFSVTFRDTTGAAVVRQFSYTAIGFGREIA